MRGYCSTRASLAPYDAPRAPTPRWELQLETDFEPIEVVVDDAGRIYATIDPIRGDDALIPHVLVIVDADGTQIASHDFRPDSVGNLFVGRDGALRATVGVSPRHLVRVSSSGEVTMLSDLPPHAFRHAVASDGTLVASLVDFHSPDQLARVREDGSVLWTSPPLDDGTCGGCISQVAMDAHDRIVIAAYTIDGGSTLMGVDPVVGTFAWRTHVDGLVTLGPAIAEDDSIRVVTGVTDSATMVTTTIVTALEPAGSIRWQTRLEGVDYEQTWEQALPIAPDGTAIVHTFSNLIAIGPDGVERWRAPEPTNLSYEAVVDATGTFIATVGPIRALDVLTGSERWHVDGSTDGPGTMFYYVSDVVLAPNRCFVGVNHGGHLFTYCDP